MADAKQARTANGWDQPRVPDELLPQVYEELRRLAAQKLAQEKPGQTTLIQASTNLTDWSIIATNVLGSDPTLFTDPQSGQFPRRFYRLFTP